MLAPIHSDFESANSQIASWKAAGQKILFTNGCFDILHRGHISYLLEAKAITDLLVLGLNSDWSVKQLKGDQRPIHKEMDRAMVLASLKMVDMVIIFGAKTPENLIKQIRPDILVKGGDYNPETMPGAAFVRSYGGQTKVLGYVDGYATTTILHKLK